MGLTQNIIETLARPIIDENNREWASRVREAELKRVEDDPAYRRISQASPESLTPMAQEQMVRLTHYLYWKNPLIRRLVEIYTDFLSNAQPKAEDTAHADLQLIIDRFWKDPYNQMTTFATELIRMHVLDGELLLPVVVNPQDGKVRIKYCDPRDIEEIKTVQDDIRFIDTIKMKRKGDIEGKIYKVIRYQIDPESEVGIGDDSLGNLQVKKAYGFRTGDCFYFRQCHLISNRGRTPLEPILDWADAHDRTLFDCLRNNALQGAFIYDVEISGAKPAEILAKRDDILANPPKPGTVRVHNEAEKWQAVSPTLNAANATDLATETRKVVALGAGRSETWLGASADVNRSTADTSQDPPLKSLERSQADFVEIIKAMIDFVIDQAILHGTLRIEADDEAARAYSVDMPDLTATDNERMAKALKDISEAFQLANDAELCDRDTGRKLFYQVAGIQQPNNLDENIQKEKDESGKEDYLSKEAPDLSAMMDKAKQDALTPKIIEPKKSDVEND